MPAWIPRRAKPGEVIPPSVELQREQILRRMPATFTTVVRGTVATSAAGQLGGGITGAGAMLYSVPLSWSARVHRISLWAPGFTPAAPLTTGWVAAGLNIAGFYPVIFAPAQSTATLPLIYTEPEDAAQHLGPGESLIAYGDGLPASLPIAFSIQLRLLQEAVMIEELVEHGSDSS